MGSICCKESENEEPHDYEGERQHLLPEAVQPVGIGQPSGIVVGNRGNLNSIMDDIVKTVENQIVDVGATDVNSLDETEYLERSNHYATTIRNCGHGFDPGNLLPQATGNPIAILSLVTLQWADLEEVRTWAVDNYNLLDSIKLKETEDLVVQFNVP